MKSQVNQEERMRKSGGVTMKKVFWIAGAVLLIGLAVGGGFWAGMMYQSRQVAQVRANFENERGPMAMGQAPNQGQNLLGEGMPGGPTGGQIGGGFPGAETIGTIKTIDGDTITISTAMDVTTVNISDSTRLEKYVPAGTVDLQVGMQVLVSGQQDNDGIVSANQVTILDDSQGARPISSQPLNPATTELEP